jgi:hypothetical protein
MHNHRSSNASGYAKTNGSGAPRHSHRRAARDRQIIAGTAGQDPLAAFCAKFTARSWREFTACPAPLKQASETIARNYGVVSVCDEDGRYVLVHYRDTTEERFKAEAQRAADVPQRGDAVRQLKGCVFDAATGELKARGFPFTPALSMSEQEFMRTLDCLAPRALVREWREGLVVRVWTDDAGVVRASITRRINALRSRRDGCPSVEEMLALAGVDLTKLKQPTGVVLVLLLVHPSNQVQTPEPVPPSAYHLDSWVSADASTTLSAAASPASGSGPSSRGHGAAVAKDSLASMRRKELDVGLPKLPALTHDEALTCFRANKSVYVQRSAEYGIVCRSLALGARYAIRGEREHLYHRFVELGTDGTKLLECVPHAHRERAAEFPVRLAADVKELLGYGECLFAEGAHLPPEDTSLFAWYVTAKTKPGATPRERLSAALDQCHPVVLYNMISLLRTKFKKRERAQSEAMSGLASSASGTTSASDDSSRSASPHE